ncbi:MAG: hypothetical protein ACRDFX_01385 [Chloroflexota bacterium]
MLDPSEDMITQQLRASVPEPDETFRPRLRSRLELENPKQPRGRRRLVWSGMAVLVAAVLAGAAIGIELSPHGVVPVSARTLLRRAMLAAASPSQSSGTAQTVITGEQPAGNLPAGASRELARRRETTTWWYRDLKHFRVNVHVDAPALRSEHQVLTSDGASAVWSRTLTQRAVRIGIPSSSRHDVVPWLFGQFVTGGPYFTAALRTFNAVPNGSHARVVGTSTEFGRKVDIVRQSPAVEKSGPDGRLAGRGYAIWWIDDQSGVVLRYREHAPADVPSIQYRVTSIYFRRPSRAQFAHVPPVNVQKLIPAVQLLSGPAQGSIGFAGPSAVFSPPPPFVALAAPSGFTLYEWDELTDQSFLDEAYAVYKNARAYVVVVEQFRRNGLPATMRTGTHAGTRGCQTWFGRYTGGDNWTAFSRGHVSILVVSNALSGKELIRYAELQTCG